MTTWATLGAFILHVWLYLRESVTLSDCESVSVMFPVNYHRLVTIELKKNFFKKHHLNLVFPFPRVPLCWAANVVARSGWHCHSTSGEKKTEVRKCASGEEEGGEKQLKVQWWIELEGEGNKKASEWQEGEEEKAVEGQCLVISAVVI